MCALNPAEDSEMSDLHSLLGSSATKSDHPSKPAALADLGSRGLAPAFVLAAADDLIGHILFPTPLRASTLACNWCCGSRARSQFTHVLQDQLPMPG